MKILYLQFIKHKTYIGHSNKNTPLFSSWFLFKMVNGIWIINVFKTIWFLKYIFNTINYLVSSNFPVWFINMDITKYSFIREYAQDSGEFCCNMIWKRGFLSNFFSISNIVKKYVLKDIYYRNYKHYNFFKKWYITRYTWPRAIIVLSVKNYHVICKEATSMFIPIIGIVDTNIKYHYYNLPILANDDSLDSISYICALMSKHILLNKYKKLILWLTFYRQKTKVNHIINFLYRFNEGNINLNSIKKKFYVFNKFSTHILLEKGLNIFFLKNFKAVLYSKIGLNFSINKKLEFYTNIFNIILLRKLYLFKNKLRLVKLHKIYYLNNIMKIKKKKKKK